MSSLGVVVGGGAEDAGALGQQQPIGLAHVALDQRGGVRPGQDHVRRGRQGAAGQRGRSHDARRTPESESIPQPIHERASPWGDSCLRAGGAASAEDQAGLDGAAGTGRTAPAVLPGFMNFTSTR